MTSSATCSSTSSLPPYTPSARGQCVMTSVKPSSAARPTTSSNAATLLNEYRAESSARYRSNSALSRPSDSSTPSSRRLRSTTDSNQLPKSSDFRPVVTQPAPYRVASRRERGPFAAITNGTRGCWTQPGRVRALRVEKYSPW
jgi:hypothetical protein